MTTFWILLALVLLRWGVLLVGAALVVRPVSDCPACREPTLLLHTPWLRRLAPLFEWRWCPACGWQGPGRRTGATHRIHVAEAPERSRVDARSR